jgi:hypothetical protein
MVLINDTSIKCNNPTYLVEDNIFANFIDGVNTYEKIYSDYVSSGCRTSDTNDVNFTLVNTDFVNGTKLNVTGNCLAVRNHLSNKDNNMSKAIREWNNNINTNKNIHIGDQTRLKQTYGNLVSTRTKLDEDVQKLLGLDTSLHEKQNILDSAVFTTLLWTILATSTLYYVFIQI